MSEKVSRAAETPPLTADEILKDIQNLNTRLSSFFSKMDKRIPGSAYLNDRAFVKVQNIKAFLNNNPEVYASVNRSLLQNEIDERLAMGALSIELGKATQQLNDALIANGQRLRKTMQAVYKRAKVDVETGLDNDSQLLQALVSDLGELFEKAAATRRKNAKNKKEGNAAAAASTH